MSAVILKNASKVFDDGERKVVALDGVNLEIKDGEFTCFVGPSGSGKSTLLNLIGGLDRPTSGDVTVGETNLARLDSSKLADLRLHSIGFVFQAYNLIPVLSARENVEFVMHLQGISADERQRRALEVLEKVGLKGLEDRRPGQLSGGQQQRVAVARAIVSRPKLVLADEPTANLDSKTARNLVLLMEELHHKEGITFVFSTHDPIVMELADRVIRLHDGKIESDEITRVH
jgi:putative ABC transport system ATP-binding protein